MADILISSGGFYHGTSSACVTDLTPPTFAGISTIDVESRGQIRAGWSAASDPTLPIRYEIYIKAGTSSGLFSTSNIAGITPNLQYDIFTMPDGSFLVNGTTYYVGVRALDGASNRDSNTVSMSVISTGVLTSIDVYECEASWSSSTTNMFYITAWAKKNESLATSSNSVLGTASYQVYDKAGAAVAGMSGSGISPDSNGLYVFSAVANSLNLSFNHYEVKVTISVDGENRVSMIDMKPDQVIHQINGYADVNPATGSIFGSFWAEEDFAIMTTGLGTGSYTVRDAGGVLIPGLSESGIVPDGNGIYVITPLSLPTPLPPDQAFIVELTAIVRGETKSTKIVLGDDPATYEIKASFSISGANMLQGTLWANKIHQLAPTAILGTASYTVYDKTGVAVAGLTESGITPDSNGMFHITPVAATLLTDLTHYLVKVDIEVGGYERSGIKGFTLLGN